MDTFIIYLPILILSYLVGSIPTGYLFSRYWCGVDITRQGSGNIGATNVARVLGARYFFVIFFIDAFKAGGLLYLIFYCLGMISKIGLHGLLFSAAAILVGNAYSVFLNFKGGKGVASTVGVLFVLMGPTIALSFSFLWLAILKLSKHAFIASLISIALITGVYFFSAQYDAARGAFLLCLNGWFFLRHIPNMRQAFR